MVEIYTVARKFVLASGCKDHDIPLTRLNLAGSSSYQSQSKITLEMSTNGSLYTLCMDLQLFYPSLTLIDKEGKFKTLNPKIGFRASINTCKNMFGNIQVRTNFVIFNLLKTWIQLNI